MIKGIDHLVLTVQSLDATADFYERALGIGVVRQADRPMALIVGNQKISVHQADHMFEPKARHPTGGAGDFCLITELPIAAVEDRLAAAGVAIELGPVAREGALGLMTSLYFRDPDGNLVEVSRYHAQA